MHADFADYYRWHYPRLVAFLYVLGASVHEAADVAQQVLAELSRQWEHVATRRAWTCSAAMRLLAQQRERRAGVRSHLVRTVDEAAWPAEHELVRRIWALPPRQRQVIAWKLMEFPPGEIATELRLSPEAVRGDLASARKALRPYLTAGPEAGR
jgi:DNA-directed RNA polymerase specialized sigma24 family protein